MIRGACTCLSSLLLENFDDRSSELGDFSSRFSCQISGNRDLRPVDKSSDVWKFSPHHLASPG